MAERCEADARISGDGAQLPEVVGAGVAMSTCRGDAAHFESLRGIVAHVALRVKSFTRSADPVVSLGKVCACASGRLLCGTGRLLR